LGRIRKSIPSLTSKARIKRKGYFMDEKHANAREQFFAAIRVLAASTGTIQARLIEANSSILRVAIDEFDGDGCEIACNVAPVRGAYRVEG